MVVVLRFVVWVGDSGFGVWCSAIGGLLVFRVYGLVCYRFLGLLVFWLMLLLFWFAEAFVGFGFRLVGVRGWLVCVTLICLLDLCGVFVLCIGLCFVLVLVYCLWSGVAVGVFWLW